jgi:hypothetical protein
MAAELPPILIVEDEPAHAELLRLVIQRARISNPVIAIHRGEDAVTFLARPPREGPLPVLVLLDLGLPGIGVPSCRSVAIRPLCRQRSGDRSPELRSRCRAVCHDSSGRTNREQEDVRRPCRKFVRLLHGEDGIEDGPHHGDDVRRGHDQVTRACNEPQTQDGGDHGDR